MRRWLKSILLFPFYVFMGIPDGNVGEVVDDGGDGGEEVAETVDMEETGNIETGEESETLESEDHNANNQTQPVIPRKAYESEKEKRQRYEQENKELRQQLESATKQQEPIKQPQTWEEHYDANPAAVIGHIDKMIQSARADFDQEKYTELVDLKASLVARSVLNAEQKASKNNFITTVNAEIYKAIPDYDTKRNELVETAKELGFTDQEAQDIFNPEVVGETAARMAKAINRVHGMLNASKTAKGKEVKTAPKVEPTGTGGFNNNNLSQKQFQKAKDTGNLDDWAAILG